jgi:hypothetical protein
MTRFDKVFVVFEDEFDLAIAQSATPDKGYNAVWNGDLGSIWI